MQWALEENGPVIYWIWICEDDYEYILMSAFNVMPLCSYVHRWNLFPAKADIDNQILQFIIKVNVGPLNLHFVLIPLLSSCPPTFL